MLGHSRRLGPKASKLTSKQRSFLIPSESVFLTILLVHSIVSDDNEENVRSRFRGRVRGPRLLSREKLADVIDGALTIEDSDQEGRKRVILRKPGGAFRRVKLIRRPRPSERTTVRPSTTFEPATEATFTTTETPTTFSPVRSSSSFSPQFEFTTPATNTFRPPRREDQAFRAPVQPRIVPTFRKPTFETSTFQSSRPQTSFNSFTDNNTPSQINRQEEVVGTIKNYSYNNEDGSFTFGYEGEDGSFKEETRGTDCVVRGKYGYIDPDGVKREFTYESGNPCTNDEEEEVEFDEQGFPILRDDGTLIREDPLDDQPIRINSNQFISQTKAVALNEEELRQFRRPKSFQQIPPINEPKELNHKPSNRGSNRNDQRIRFSSKPNFSNSFETTTHSSVVFRPRPTITTTPEPIPSVTPTAFENRFEEKPNNALTPELNDRPFVFFGSTNRPPFTIRPQHSSPFNFDSELENFRNKHTTERPTTNLNEDIPVDQRPKKFGGNFNHELVFDRANGKHQHSLVQVLPEGTEVRIGESLKSFSDNHPSTTPSSFQNSFFQSLNTRFNSPPPTTRQPFIVQHTPSTPTQFPTDNPRPLFNGHPNNIGSFSSTENPNDRRPTAFPEFNQPHQQNSPRPSHETRLRLPTPLGGANFFRPHQEQLPVSSNENRPPFGGFHVNTQPQQRPDGAISVFNRSPDAPSQNGGRFFRPPPNGVVPVQQVSFGTQVDKPVFSRFGIPQPFQPSFGRSLEQNRPNQPQQSQGRFHQPSAEFQGRFQPPQALNFFSK